MCGICGVILTRDPDPGELEALVSRMTGALAHRGPDGRRTWTAGRLGLGHTRLAIIDLSDEAAQPLSAPGSPARIVFNGELYNYRELRRILEGQGRVFRTRSDTEVVLQAVLEWGPPAFERMLGMWGLALYDPDRRELLLSRDRFGIKPLYYAVAPDGLVFGSEIRALLASGLVAREPHRAACAVFLSRGETDCAGATFFEGIRRVPAGSWTRIPLDPVRPPPFERYWDPAPLFTPPGNPLSFPEATSEFRRLLESAVDFHLRSDVPVGMCLSGGIDSSSLVALAAARLAEGGTAPYTFTASFPGQPFDESRYATAVAERFRVRRVFVAPTATDFDRDLERLVEAQEEPFGSTGVYLQWRLFQQIQDSGLKVVLDGQGSDEYLGGYLTFFLPLLVDQIRGGHLGAAVGTMAEIVRHKRPPRLSAGYLLAIGRRALGRRAADSGEGERAWLADAMRTAGAASTGDTELAELRPEPGVSRFRRALWAYFFRYSLPGLLRYEDKNAMAFGVESRVPYLDHRLVEFAAALPDEYLCHRGVTKRILRDAMRDALPESVVTRRDKLGFASPIGPWVAQAIVPRLARLLESSFAAEYVDPLRVRHAAECFLRRPGGRHLGLWRVYSVLAWHERFLAR
ncbi:MAG: asparagine synthase (glutamine-hydrolyzing) [Gemmatimonadales bacterium]